MFIRLHGLALPYDVDADSGLDRLLAKRLGPAASRVRARRIARRSIDARGGSVKIVYSVDLRIDGDIGDLQCAMLPEERAQLKVAPGSGEMKNPPIVIGAGPAGLFAALLLASHGYRPTLLERGEPVEARAGALRGFEKTRIPDPERNALFGIGGAGTFSDGKLTTTVRHPWLSAVLDLLIEHGAPPVIAVDARPHIGTDLLGPIVTSIVSSIERAGGRVLTRARVDDIVVSGGGVAAVRFGKTVQPTEHLLAGIGHSARDTLELIASRGAIVEPKPFQIGVRVEHPQAWLDRRQYGSAAGHPALGAADYKLTARIGDVPVFSFCMCPGGWTIPTVNEPGCLCLNGMSNSRRDSAFASSGIVATVLPENHGGVDLRSCLALVRKVETACFEVGQRNYTAPAQRLVDFAEGSMSATPMPASSYSLGLEPARLDLLLPSFVADPIRAALSKFDRDIPGFLHPEALALAPEARASSPLRMVRDPVSRESMGLRGLYPVGEGSGYAGGIMSSALDGLETARRIIESAAPPRDH